MTKDKFILLLKVFAAIISAILSVLGASALCSCSTSHSIDGYGHTTIITTDTTSIVHQGYLKTK